MGEMQGKELEEFLELLKEDEEFAIKVNERSLLLAGIEDHYSKELKKELKVLEKEERTKSKVIPLHLKKSTWAIAASLLLIITFTLIITNNNKSPEKLFLAYYEPHPNVINPSERSADSLDNFSIAMRFYSAKQYEKAVELLEAGAIKDPDNIALKFYLALSNLSLANNNKAIEDLKIVIKTGHPTLSEPAQWYLGLAYLRLSQFTEAKSIFSSINSKGGLYSDEAAKILNQL